jgi:cytochrome c oxidase subunit 2
MLINVSNFVQAVDTAFVLIFAISAFFLVGITVTMLYFIYKYHKKRSPKATQIHGNTTLEIIWTGIPLILVMVMFFFGWTGFKPMKEKAPDDALPVTAYARMWSFGFEYPNGKVTDSLYVPQGRAVDINLVSQDVLHSFYIPAFRLKQDMVPGKEQNMWFIGNSPGSYDLFCAEYCGQRHSYMISSVVVMPDSAFNAWYADTTGVMPGGGDEAKTMMAGQVIMQKNGCFACHSLDGSKLVGPTYKGIWGKTEKLSDGSEIVVDEEYIRTSIYDPNAQIVDGYAKGLMISYKDNISEKEIDDIIEYLKTLN